MKTKQLLLSLCAAAVMLLSPATRADASFIPVPPEGMNADIATRVPAFLTYNAATEVFTATASFPTLASAAVLAPGLISVAPIVASDIIGSFSLTATIDHLGNVLGGTFTLVGASATLGIANTELLAGNVSNGGFGSGIFQLSGGLTFVDPAFGAAFGPVALALMDFTGGVAPESFVSDLSTFTSSTSPDIFLIPEPSSMLLFTLACAAFWALGRRGGAAPRFGAHHSIAHFIRAAL